MNVQTALELAARLTSSTSPRLDVELLLAKSLDKPRTYLRTWPLAPLAASQQTEFLDLLARRVAGEPMAYILGEQEFWSLPLQVNSSTLIPRADTELLVQLALAHLPAEAETKILDLGTGSGCIALALAHERPDALIVAVDLEPAACELARQNARQLGYQQVQILQSHWFSAINDRFNLIVSNPPYIDACDPHLAELKFEPLGALVAGDQGLADLRFIIEQAPEYLLPNGWLLVEHGWQQGHSVRQLFTDRGYVNIATHADLGGNERVTLGRHLSSTLNPL